jgi:AcrR family transcriptional regulator
MRVDQVLQSRREAMPVAAPPGGRDRTCRVIGDLLPSAPRIEHSEREIALIRSAYRTMSRHGTERLSLRKVAEDAGVSPPLLVYHFGGKDELLLATMRWALVSTVNRIRRRLDGITDAREALAELIDAVFVSPRANRDFYLVYLDMVQYSVRRPSFSGLTEMLREQVNGSFAAVVTRGVEARVFRVDSVELASRQARAVVEGGFIQWLQDTNWEQTHAQLKAHCHRAILTMLSVAPPDPDPAPETNPRRP